MASSWIGAHNIAMETIFRSLLARCRSYGVTLLWLGLAASCAFAQEEKLYYFIDEHGVPHISNTVTDPRYKPYTPGKRGAEPDASSHVEEPLAPEDPAQFPPDDDNQNPEPPGANSLPAEEPPHPGQGSDKN
jgi:hypothetical protein